MLTQLGFAMLPLLDPANLNLYLQRGLLFSVTSQYPIQLNFGLTLVAALYLREIVMPVLKTESRLGMYEGSSVSA